MCDMYPTTKIADAPISAANLTTRTKPIVERKLNRPLEGNKGQISTEETVTYIKRSGTEMR